MNIITDYTERILKSADPELIVCDLIISATLDKSLVKAAESFLRTEDMCSRNE